MKKTAKIITLALMIMVVMLFSSTIVNAAPGTEAGTDEGAIVDTLFSTNNSQGTNGIQTVGGKIVSIITTVGIIVAVVVLLILGIKYMMGSASEKAEYKKTMIPYLVGAVLIFGASAIAKAVIAASKSIVS